MDFGQEEFENNDEIEENLDYDDNNNFNEMDDENNFNNDFVNNNDDYNYNENLNNNQFIQDNNFNIENNNFNENDLFAMNMDNIKLKDKIQKLKNLLIQKNNEINNLKIQFSNQYQIMQQNLNKYKNIAKNYSALQNEINMTKQKYLREIKIKNNIIYKLQNGDDIKDIKLSNLTLDENIPNSNIILNILQQIKSIQQNILEEPDSDIINQEDFQKLEKEQQIQILLNDINNFSKKLNEYKNKNMREIVQLRNLLDSNDSKQENIKDQFYLDMIDLLKNLKKNNITDIIFPEYSLNDNDKIRKKNILNIIKVLIEYIINKKNNNKNNYNDDELNKRLEEMSELLSKNSQNLSISTKNNTELKLKYDELKKNYDELVKKNELENKKLINDLNKKNQQIKSLEHINTRLSNQINESKVDDKKNISNKKQGIKYGKINKGTNNKKNNNNKINLGNNLFNKDEKSEKNLEMFLNKFTNGEYGNCLKNNNDIIDIDNLKEEIDNFNKKINKDLEVEEKK